MRDKATLMKIAARLSIVNADGILVASSVGGVSSPLSITDWGAFPVHAAAGAPDFLHQ